MPILPENLARYPGNWSSEVVPRIRARSGNRCECTGQCGRHELRCNARNGVRGAWLRPGRFASWRVLERHLHKTGVDLSPPVKEGRHSSLITIVLTVMHLDHQPENCADENLLHGCQACHNCYDAGHRRETRFWSRRRKSKTEDFFQ